MRLVRNVLLTRRTLFSHKLRTFLALVGISTGVAAVIVMVAIGRGAEAEVIRLIQEMGTNLIVVTAQRTEAFAGREFVPGNVRTLTADDADAILDHSPLVANVAPSQQQRLTVRRGTFSVETKILATTPAFREIRNFRTALGEFFSEDDERRSARVAVLGNSVKENLFGNEYPLGEIVRIENIPFEVVGVLSEKGISAEGSNEDNQILIPLRTGLRRVFNQSNIRNVHIQAVSREAMRPVEAEIRELLRERHRLVAKDLPDDFTVQNQITALEAENETATSFTLLIAGVAAISLIVGGIGILAVMLIAVRERRSEIGLRMAVGARQRDILIQFLSEALILGVVGGLVGVFLGVLGGIILGWTTRWPTVVPMEFVGIALAFSLSVGLFFGVYPAHRASLLFPIDALRSE
ncbi:MAG: ABC transporter permease [Gemmatimonadetes bacterium]|nr:ABC transporter permease [Gemmatimonadota bacterium]